MKEFLVSVIIANWNGRDVLPVCLSSIYNQSYKDVEIILVDNNSSDGSVPFVKRNYPKVQIIPLANNVGFAEANNIGVAQSKGNFLLLLNNDAEVTPEAIGKLVRRMEKETTVGVVQPMILFKNSPYYPDGVINSIGSFLTSTGFLYHIGYGKKPDRAMYNTSMPIYSAYGACMLIRKTFVDRIGLFDPDFFAYFEESDFCGRVWLAGSTVLYEPGAVVYHRGGVTARKFGREKIFYHSFKNRIASYLKNLEWKKLVVILPIHILLCLIAAVSYGIRGNVSFALAILRGIAWNGIHMRATIEKRRRVQREVRIVRDRDYMPAVRKNPRLLYYWYFLKDLAGYQD